MALEKYSPKNQCLIASQLPDVPVDQIDVRTMREWNAAGYKVVKGSRKIKIWIPRTGQAKVSEVGIVNGASPDQERTYFVMRRHCLTHRKLSR